MSETALLETLAEKIRETCGYTEQQCQVEYDEVVPATAGEFYICVMPGGWVAGPNNAIGGGVLDEIFAADVSVIARARRVPRDRRRGIFLDNLDGLNQRIRSIITSAAHFSYVLMNSTNLKITDSSEKFIEPLKFRSVEPRPREVSPVIWGGTEGKEPGGLARTVRFDGARRIQHVGVMK